MSEENETYYKVFLLEILVAILIIGGVCAALYYGDVFNNPPGIEHSVTATQN